MSNNSTEKLNISIFLKELLTKKVMAYVLDLARVSDMNDRQFKQYERSVKNFIYEQVKAANTIICINDNNFSVI